MCSLGGVFGRKNAVPTRAISIRPATPKNGPRQEIEPSWPPTSGPAAMPRPSAASNRMIACATEPLAADTIVARAVAMNSALPRPQPARKPTMAPMLFDDPARAEKMMISTRPVSSVRLAPIRLETTPVISIAMPVTAM